MVCLGVQKVRNSLRQASELLGRFDAVERVGELARRGAREPVTGTLDNHRPLRRVSDAFRTGWIGKQRSYGRVHSAVLGQLAVWGFISYDGQQTFNPSPARGDVVADSAIRVGAWA